MNNNLLKIIITAGLLMNLTGCGTLFDKDNTPTPAPLPKFSARFQPNLLWMVKTGNGTENQYLKMPPAVDSQRIYTTSSNGYLSAINKSNGQLVWQISTKLNLNAGPGVGDNLIVVAGQKGEVLAYHLNGNLAWKSKINGEVLANPVVARGNVVIKTTDGYLYALSTDDGHTRWSLQETEPNLMLHAASTPLVSGNNLIVGFANGNLYRIQLNTGRVEWEQSMAEAKGAFSIERMIDIDATPVMYQDHLFAATYQGKINSVNLAMGNIRWSQDISSYTGMTADDAAVYISDAKSHVWAFQANDGVQWWQQKALEARVITAPAQTESYLVVGDAQGYLHWLRKSDGSFVARVSAGNAIYATPLIENNVVYVFTSNGNLLAYKMP